MSLPYSKPPASICILRLSAIGDISHTLPVVRTLQKNWPESRITWVIGKTEHTLVADIPGIEFVVFDKKRGMKAYVDFARSMAGRQFDVLLHMQMSLRASMLSLLVKAQYKLGFDRQRAKDLQWLFTNSKIPYQPRQHVIDSFFGFSETLGLKEHVISWDIPVPELAIARSMTLLPESAEKILVISPCSSMAYRNWTVAGYVAVADYAAHKYNMRIVLTGGNSAIEQQYASEISKAASVPVINLVGKTSLKELLAVLQRATLVISPDAGPAHLATAVGVPVLGLYATTNPDRARPYLSKQWEISHYDEAVKEKYGKPVAEMPWGTRVRDAGTMERIRIDEVTAKLDAFMQTQ